MEEMPDRMTHGEKLFVFANGCIHGNRLKYNYVNGRSCRNYIRPGKRLAQGYPFQWQRTYIYERNVHNPYAHRLQHLWYDAISAFPITCCYTWTNCQFHPKVIFVCFNAIDRYWENIPVKRSTWLEIFRLYNIAMICQKWKRIVGSEHEMTLTFEINQILP